MKKILILSLLTITFNTFAYEATQKQCDQLQGFMVCANTMCELENDGRGDLQYWIRTVVLQERNVVNMSEGLQNIVKVMEKEDDLPSRMKRKLLNLSDEFFELDEDHYGDMNYYIRESNKLERAIDRKVSDLVDIYKEYCF